MLYIKGNIDQIEKRIAVIFSYRNCIYLFFFKKDVSVSKLILCKKERRVDNHRKGINIGFTYGSIYSHFIIFTVA